MAAHVRAMLDVQARGRGGVRLRQQHPRAGGAGRRRRRVRDSRASCRNTSGRSSARARGRSAGRRSRATPRTSPRPTSSRSRCSPTTQALCRWIRLAQRARGVSGTAGAHLLARLRRARAVRAGDQRSRAARRRDGADRDRPRSSRRRLGRVAQSRDRRHARRQRRHRRLAGPERAAQHVVPARHGCRCITAAASGSAIRSTPAWSSSPTARARRTRNSSAC